MSKIVILYDEVSPMCLSYTQVLIAIEHGQKCIVTNCLNFACFDYLRQGGDVLVVKCKDNTGIVLSELLENNRPYTNKQIRPAHNIQKMIIAGGIQFLPLLPDKSLFRFLVN